MSRPGSRCPHVHTAQYNTWDEVLSKRQAKECDLCDTPGPNLWVCLYNKCLTVGCGEAGLDHSTVHGQSKSHPLTLNLTTLRIWCYICETEVFRDNNQPPFPDSLRSRSVVPVSCATHSTEHTYTPQRVKVNSQPYHQMDRRHSDSLTPEPDLSSSDEDDDEAEKPTGLTGLQNIGNTCYMNAALQSLSNCLPLTRFFLDCDGYVRSEKKPMLSRSYQRLVQEMWHKRRPAYLTPSSVASGIKIVHPMFRGYSQQDSQEFLRCFMDQLHEELKQPVVVQHDADDDKDDSSSSASSHRSIHERLPQAKPAQVEVVDHSQSEDEYETCDSGLSSDRSSMENSMSSCEDYSGSVLVNSVEPLDTTPTRNMSQNSELSTESNVSTETVQNESRDEQEGEVSSLSSCDESSQLLNKTNKLPSKDSGIQCTTSSEDVTRDSARDLARDKHVKEAANLAQKQAAGVTNFISNRNVHDAVRIDSTVAQVHGLSSRNEGDNSRELSRSAPQVQCMDRDDVAMDSMTTTACESPHAHVSDNTRSKTRKQTGSRKMRSRSTDGVRNASPDARSHVIGVSKSRSQDIHTQIVDKPLQRSRPRQNSDPDKLSRHRTVPHHVTKKEKQRRKKYHSVISDVFDGRILSSVQCLTCERVSSTKETFQDLSLPIPTRDHMRVLATQSQLTAHKGACGEVAIQNNWFNWMFGWMKNWFWGPAITLQNCLAAFFSADELKGDNMYSCEKCKKLRNGIKYSKVLKLPEVLCIHLKRFRHEFMFSSKIGTFVSFPIDGLDMRPYLHKDCEDQITEYDLVAVICHHGTAGGGHYTSYALNHRNQQWYEFDDQLVTEVDPQQVENCEAYVLFYRKKNDHMLSIRQKADEILKFTENSFMKFWISRQWINKFNTFAEPGPISNHDFICKHGGVYPQLWNNVNALAIEVPQKLWEYCHTKYGGGPAVTHLHQCNTCLEEMEKLRDRQIHERETFLALHEEFEAETKSAIYAISMHWFKEWENFVRSKTDEPPGPIDNSRICVMKQGVAVLRHNADVGQVSQQTWHFMHGIYGGGPEIITRRSLTNDS